jgi:FtsH-binding integral membrane protein
MSAEVAANAASRPRAPFAPYHPWDRNYFLAVVAIIWIGVVLGFGGDLIRHFSAPHVAYPLIVHVHAIAFAGWLATLSAQVLLIRAGRQRVHRKLGIAAIGLAAIMVILGPLTAIAMQRARLGTPESDPSFLSAQLLSIVAFAALAAAAFAFRDRSSAHKRLILMATLAISDAGFARLLGGSVHALFGGGFLASLAGIYLGSDILIGSLGVYDIVTRRRLHPAYVSAALWLGLIQVTAIALLRSPAWTAVTLKLIGH